VPSYRAGLDRATESIGGRRSLVLSQGRRGHVSSPRADDPPHRARRSTTSGAAEDTALVAFVGRGGDPQIRHVVQESVLQFSPARAGDRLSYHHDPVTRFVRLSIRIDKERSG